MIALNQFIFEAIQRAEIEKNLKFIKVTDDEFDKIIDNELENGKHVGLDDNGSMKDELVFFEVSDKYKIMYNDTLLGVVTYLLPDALEKVLKTKTKSNMDLYNKVMVKTFLIKFIKYHYDDEVYPSEVIFDKPNKNESFEDYEERIFNHTAYICLWELFKDAKDKLDINEISLVKIFFEKLKSSLKDKGIKYLFANGKDERITKLYRKLTNGTSCEKTFKMDEENDFSEKNSTNAVIKASLASIVYMKI